MDNTQNIINMKDLTDRAEELEDQQNDEGIIEDSDDSEEYYSLIELIKELQGMGGDHKWRGEWYPAYLISDSYFEEYMDEMLEDIGDLPKNLPCYLTITVDYNALKQDYSRVEVDGETYWVR